MYQPLDDLASQYCCNLLRFKRFCRFHCRSNPTVAQEQAIDPHSEQSLNTSNFRGTKPTKVIVHGFTHNAHKPWVQNMTKQLLIAVSKIIGILRAISDLFLGFKVSPKA